MYLLEDLGWGPFFDQQTEQPRSDSLTPMRVAEEQRGAYVLWSADGAFEAVIPGRLRHEAEGRDYLPRSATGCSQDACRASRAPSSSTCCGGDLHSRAKSLASAPTSR